MIVTPKMLSMVDFGVDQWRRSIKPWWTDSWEDAFPAGLQRNARWSHGETPHRDVLQQKEWGGQAPSRTGGLGPAFHMSQAPHPRVLTYRNNSAVQRKDSCASVRGSFICNNPEPGKTQLSVGGCTGEELRHVPAGGYHPAITRNKLWVQPWLG